MNRKFKRVTALGSALTLLSGLAGCQNGTPQASPSSPATSAPIPSAAQGTATTEKPNVVYIVLDDMGFGDLGCYGSSIDTPNIDLLAAQGIQYTNYYTNPMSSPSRASLLTGCEANLVGMGATSDIDLGDAVPNVHGRIYPEHGTLADTLSENGYQTITTGKWHLGPYDEFSPDGDKSHWPSGKGFDKNYSFVGSQVNQFQPGGMIEGDRAIVPDTSDPNYHLSNDIVDQSLRFVTEAQDDPFFLHLNFGAVHGPFNVAQSYIDKYKGKFDHGWDVEREKIFARQKELGMFPADAQLSDRNFDVKAWDTLTDVEKAVATRHMEVYAGFLAHTDEQIGRLMKELQAQGKYENTLFVLVSDNGASSNGADNGVPMAHAKVNFNFYAAQSQYDLIDQFGNAQYGTQYNKGWANVSNTPLRSYKAKAYNGGVRTACIVSWTNGIQSPGRISDQLIAVQDITPTVLSALQIKQLDTVGGVAQHPMQGISFAESFASETPMKNARTELAIMLFMDRMYTDESGYMLVTNEKKANAWDLYDMKNDPGQLHNLAVEMPEKVSELTRKLNQACAQEMNAQNLVIDAAMGVKPAVLIERYGELAKDALNVVQNKEKPKLPETMRYVEVLKALTFEDPKFGYRGMGTAWYRSPEARSSARDYTYDPKDGFFYSLASAPIMATSHTIEIPVDAPEGAQGVILANGGIDGGYSIYVKDNQLIYEYNNAADRQKVIASKPLPVGETVLGVEYQKINLNEGTLTLTMNEETVAQQDIHTLPVFISYDYISFGSDVGSKVSLDYTDDFAFTGTIGKVKMHLGDDVFK